MSVTDFKTNVVPPVPEASTPKIALAVEASGAVISATKGAVGEPVPPLETGKIPSTFLSKSTLEAFAAYRA